MPSEPSLGIRTAIVDDEPPARAKLRRLLSEAEGFHLVGEAATGIEAVNLILREKPALVFLDVSMPDINGFAVARAIPEETRPHIVFVTAHDDRALEAFEVHAVDYLLKPVDPDRFFAMLARVRTLETARQATMEALLHKLPAPSELPKRFLLTDGDRAVFVTPSEIERAESARNYVVVHARGQRFILRSTLDEFHAQLDPEHFVRMNRSHLVHLDFVKEMVAVGHGEYRVRLMDGTDLVWSRRFSPGAQKPR
ncbi:MAG: response regulator transcription factor [Bryobacterales bacterium]|nr:response regulator transcription factor [Bryobacterales bacterium]